MRFWGWVALVMGMSGLVGIAISAWLDERRDAREKRDNARDPKNWFV